MSDIYKSSVDLNQFYLYLIIFLFKITQYAKNVYRKPV